MLFDIEREINEVLYLLLMFALQATEASAVIDVGGYRLLAQESLGAEFDKDDLISLHYKGLIYLTPPEGRSHRDGSDDEQVSITIQGIAVLINGAPKFLNDVVNRYDVAEGTVSVLVPLLDIDKVPAADRYVSTADNQNLFADLASELDKVKSELVRDQNANELPIPLQNKRAMVAELDGLIGQIKAGYVRLSDLTQRARPLVKNIAETCKDVGVIAGFAYTAYEIIGKILAALF